MRQSDVLRAIAVTAELTGAAMSEPAARMMLADLAGFDPAAVIGALQKVRREGVRLTVGNVINRIDDGRPGAEEAWAMCPKGEDETVVWTQEMSTAFGVVAGMIADGGLIPARMAFLEKYRAEVARNRAEGISPAWAVSLGHDEAGREAAVSEAARLGRISKAQAIEVCPAIAEKITPAIEGEAKLVPVDFLKKMPKAIAA